MRHLNLGKTIRTCIEELQQHPHIERGIVREQEDGIFGAENARRRILAVAGEQEAEEGGVGGQHRAVGSQRVRRRHTIGCSKFNNLLLLLILEWSYFL
jgi:hypothetical protein